MVTLMKKQKAEPKPVNLDFPIPDYRRDPRYISAVEKLADLRNRAQGLRLSIDRIKAEYRVDSVTEQARKLLAGETVTPPRHDRVEQMYAELRIVEKAIPLQEHEVEKTKNAVCAEQLNTPGMAEHVNEIFRNTGAAMAELFEALKNEQYIRQRLKIAGIVNAQWMGHPIFRSMLPVDINNPSNPIKSYLEWNRKYFGSDAK